MKRLLVLIMCLVLCGCNGCDNKKKSIEDKPVKKVYPGYFEKITDTVSWIATGEVYVLHYQGCDYLFTGAGVLIHSKTCPNPIHKESK